MLPLSNKFVEAIDADVGEDGKFQTDYVKQVRSAANHLFDEMRNSAGVECATDLRAETLNKPRITKDKLIDWLETAVFLLDSCSLPLLRFASGLNDDLSELKNEKIVDQRKIIELQDKLIEKKDEELTAVQSVVKSELKSYSSVLEKSCTAVLAPRKIAAAVRKIADKEDRSKNLVVYGIREEENEMLESRVIQVLDNLDEKPKISNCCRLGTVKSGTVRPIRFTLNSTDSAYQILKKSRKLKEIDG